MNPPAGRLVERAIAWMLIMVLGTGTVSCRNPAQSTLPPSDMAPAGTPFPPLPKGDAYADESVVSADTRIDPGDTVEVLVHRGAGEEKFSSTVRESGHISLSFVDVDVRGLTVSEAEAKITDGVRAYMRNPKVQVSLKKRGVHVKRIFVFGEVRKPGMYPMSRNMTVLHALAAADNYTETALVEEIRIIRGDLNRPQIYTADLARLWTYGDMTRNVALEENDVVYVPREHLGDATETAKKLMPVIMTAVAPFYPLFAIPLFFPAAQIR
jgi:polysaccharide export outer membrane protein